MRLNPSYGEDHGKMEGFSQNSNGRRSFDETSSRPRQYFNDDDEDEQPLSVIRLKMFQNTNANNNNTPHNADCDSQFSQIFGNSSQCSQYSQIPFDLGLMPKTYSTLKESDCIDMIGDTLKSLLMNTCSEEFHEKCYEMLKVNSSDEASRQLKSRLTEICEKSSISKRRPIKKKSCEEAHLKPKSKVTKLLKNSSKRNKRPVKNVPKVEPPTPAVSQQSQEEVEVITLD